MPTPLVRALTAIFLTSFFVGCQALQDSLGLEAPRARATGVSFQDLDLQSLGLAFEVEVENPYAVDLPLLRVGYDLASGAVPFLEGSAPLSGVVPAGGRRTLELPVRVQFAGLLEVLSGVSPGSVVPYEAGLDFFVDAPAIGEMRLPVRRTGELPIPTVPRVSVNSMKWDEVGLSGVRGAVELQLENGNSFPIDLEELSYSLSVSGRQIASAGIEETLALEAENASTLRIPLSLSALDLGLGLIDLLKGSGGQTTPYSLQGSLSVDTPFGAFDSPFQTDGSVPLSN